MLVVAVHSHRELVHDDRDPCLISMLIPTHSPSIYAVAMGSAEYVRPSLVNLGMHSIGSYVPSVQEEAES